MHAGNCRLSQIYTVKLAADMNWSTASVLFAASEPGTKVKFFPSRSTTVSPSRNNDALTISGVGVPGNTARVVNAEKALTRSGFFVENLPYSKCK